MVVDPIDGYVQPFRDFFGSEKLLHRSHVVVRLPVPRSIFRGFFGPVPDILTGHPTAEAAKAAVRGGLTPPMR